MTQRPRDAEADASNASFARRAWRQVRRLGRGAAFVAAAAGYTLYAGVAVRMQRSGDARARATARHQQRGARLLLRILGVRVTLKGRTEALSKRGAPALLVCNHLGLLDPFVLAAQLRMALVGKAEIAAWAGAGWVARTMGVVFVTRGQAGGVRAFVERVQERLRSGVHVLAFPEGTTNAARQVRPFKTGVFRGVAGWPGANVVPLYLHVRGVAGRPATEARRQRVIWASGEAALHPDEPALAHAWRLLALGDVTMEVRVGDPIAAGEHGRKELARRAQAQIEAMAAEAFAADEPGEEGAGEAGH